MVGVGGLVVGGCQIREILHENFLLENAVQVNLFS